MKMICTQICKAAYLLFFAPFFFMLHAQEVKIPELPTAAAFYDMKGDGDFGFFKGGKDLYGDDENAFQDLHRHGGLKSNFSEEKKYKMPYNFSYSFRFELFGFFPYSITDINRDGQVDLIPGRTGSKGRASLFISNQNASFDEHFQTQSCKGLDLNADGKLDYVQQKGNAIFGFLQQSNGQFGSEDAFATLSLEAYNYTFDSTQWKKAREAGFAGKIMPNEGLSTEGVGGVLDISLPVANINLATSALDLNKDGRLDLIDAHSRAIHYGVGANTYISSALNGDILPKDLNGDGISDYIVYGGTDKKVTAFIYEGDQQFREHLLSSNMASDPEIYCYDFDRDGDIDILITFSHYLNNVGAFTLMCKNDGKGNFEIIEQADTKKWKFAACVDADNDGYFDLLLMDHSTDTTVSVLLRKGNADLSFGAPEVLFSLPILTKEKVYNTLYIKELNLNAVDLNGDGMLEIWFSGIRCIWGIIKGSDDKWGLIRDKSSIKVYSYASTKANIAPQKPNKPNLRYNAGTGRLDISWDLGQDAENTSLDISYALKVGSAPGLGDMYAAHANADGSRRNFLTGNMEYERSHFFDCRSWKPGKYYVSIQAIDAHFKGSTFSEEAVFEHNYLPAFFNLSQSKISIADTLEINYPQYPDMGYAYQWNFDGGVMVDSLLGSYRLYFPEAGTKKINLLIRYQDTLVSDRYEVSLSVIPNKIEVGGTGYVYGEATRSVMNYVLADYDMDGDMDAVLNDGLWDNDGKGKYTKKAAIFNLDLHPRYVQWFDWDRNGALDMFYSSGNPTSLSYLKHGNKGSFSVVDLKALMIEEYQPVGGILNSKSYVDFINQTAKTQTELKNQGHSWHFIDMNNDGLMDIFKDGTAYINHDNKIFKQSILKYDSIWTDGSSYRPPQPPFWAVYYRSAHAQVLDYNKDGYKDLVELLYKGTYSSPEGDGENLEGINFWENKGEEGHYTKHYLPFPATIASHRHGIYILQDFNNDGLLDFAFVRSSQVLCILVNKNNTYFEERYNLEVNTSIGFFDTYYPLRGSSSYDFDNNGYMDILVFLNDKKRGGKYPFIFYMGEQGLLHQGFVSDFPVSNVSSNYTDITGDGVPDYCIGAVTASAYYSDIPVEYMRSAATNTKPSMPTGLIAQQNQKGLLIEWEPAVDAQTPFVHMRYNLSVKKKGSSGADAYIISPLNNGEATMAVLPRSNIDEGIGFSPQYILSTRFEIPASALPLGELEIKVQAIDQWDAQSDFCSPFIIKIEEKPAFEIPAQVCFASPVNIKYSGVQSGTPIWDFDGGKILSGSGFGPYSVQWNTISGNKTITLNLGENTYQVQTRVLDAIVFDIDVPTPVFCDLDISFDLPAVLPKEAKFEWDITSDRHCYALVEKRNCPNQKLVSLQAEVGKKKGLIRFPEQGSPNSLELSLTLSHYGCKATKTKTILLSPAMKAPEIKVLGQQNNQVEILWDTDYLDDVIESIIIYKEGMYYNDFREIARLPKSALSYVDQSSNVSARSDRYYISGIMPLRGNLETPKSPIHQSVHLTINKGMNGQWNLLWNPYVGTPINTYTILRGATPSTMTSIAMLSGSATSFTDVNPNPDQNYYALVYEAIPFYNSPAFAGADKKGSVIKNQGENLRIQTNTVFTEDAGQIIPIERMNILAIQPKLEINKDQMVLHLYPEIFPTTATYQNVSWSIIAGAEKAQIDRLGVLTAKPKQSGKITVQAKSTDGFNIVATKEIIIQAIPEESCNPPFGLNRSMLTDSSVNLSWAGSNESYTLAFRHVDSYLQTEKTTTALQYTLQASDFPSSGVYTWSVKGHCGDIVSGIVEGSNFQISKSTEEPPTSCLAPTNLNVVMINDSNVQLSWNGASLSYNLEYKLKNSSTWTTIAATQSTIHGMAIYAPFSSYGEYNWRVQSICENGELSEFINGINFILKPPPSSVNYTLKISKIGEGSVSPNVGSHTFAEGAEVSLQADATTANWQFYAWVISGQDTVKTSQFTLAMNESKLATAIFKIKTKIDPAKEASAWRIYPNPVSEKLFVEACQGILKIINAQGGVVKAIYSPGNIEIDVQDLKSGTYFLQSPCGTIRFIKH